MDGRHIFGVQACAGNDFAEHLRTMTIDRARSTLLWLKSGGSIELWGWRRVKVKRGGKAVIWQPRIKKIGIEDLG